MYEATRDFVKPWGFKELVKPRGSTKFLEASYTHTHILGFSQTDGGCFAKPLGALMGFVHTYADFSLSFYRYWGVLPKDPRDFAKSQGFKKLCIAPHGVCVAPGL